MYCWLKEYLQINGDDTDNYLFELPFSVDELVINPKKGIAAQIGISTELQKMDAI